jgi:hypothetical protein
MLGIEAAAASVVGGPAWAGRRPTLGRNPWQHRWHIPRIPGTPDPRIQAVSAWLLGLNGPAWFQSGLQIGTFPPARPAPGPARSRTIGT